MTSHHPDFLLSGFRAESEQEEENFGYLLEFRESELMVLAQHHTPNTDRSYYLLFDLSAEWGIPGASELRALYLRRDAVRKTFRFEYEQFALPSLAQSWLIARGCPKEPIELGSDVGPKPADGQTEALQQRLMTDGAQYEVMDSITCKSYKGGDNVETAALLRARDETNPVPFRVLLDHFDASSWTNTLREGGFRTHEDATEWWEKYMNGEGAPMPRSEPTARPAASPTAPQTAARSGSRPTR